MILHKTEQILNLSASRELPEGVIKGLFIRWTGTNQAAQAVTLAQLGTIRVNFRGTDIVNTTVSFFNAMNNLHWGASEFSSAAGGAFVASVYVPFHAPFDDQNGIYNRLTDKGVFFLQNTTTAVVVLNGTVEVYYIYATGVAQYIALWLNQNLQAGAAGQVVDRIQSYNVSSIYFTENAIVSGQVNIYQDGKSKIQATQAVLKAFSNLMNRVETAITLLQVNLNPLNQISAALSDLVEVNITVNAGGTYETNYLSFLFDEKMRSDSGTFLAQSLSDRVPRGIPSLTNPASRTLSNT